MKKFAVGQQYGMTDWFTGASLDITVKAVKNGKATFKVVRHEMDGTHSGKETFDIVNDDEGNEQVVMFVYNGNKCTITAKEEENTMKETRFELNGVIYYATQSGYYFAQPIGGIKKRIKKDAYEQAWQEQADAEKAQREAAVKAKMEEEERAALEGQKKVTGNTKEAKTDTKPSDKKDAKKGQKKPRKSKDIAFTYEWSPTLKVTLTAKQVDFIKHIPDTCFYENGLDSTPWCDVLADEIGGQFAGKPMTVGAMISTLREKGLINVNMNRINGKKAKYFYFTPSGKDVARELGLH